MKVHRAADGERILAVFIDFENLALGFGGRRDRFNIEKVLERLVEKGKIVAKKAYADWSRFGFYTGAMHEAAVELIEIPKRTQTGKNSADIRMCVDAMDLAYSKFHIDTFVVVSGDSDFSPLVSKLKELGKHVIGLGLSDSTSELLRDNCDEFIYYEDLDRAPIAPLTENMALPETKRKAFALLLDSLLALRRENKEVIFSSMVKDTMKRKKPSFNEEYHGYRTFSELLEDAQRNGLVELEKHKTSGTYVVVRFGSEPRSGGLPPGPRPVVLPPSIKPMLPAAINVQDLGRPVEGATQYIGGDRRRIEEEPIKPRKIVTLPPRPIAPIPVAPLPAASHQEEPEDDFGTELDNRIPLGRELIEEVDLIDEDPDEVPSYMPRKIEAKSPRKATTPASKPSSAKSSTPAKSRVVKPGQPAAGTVTQPVLGTGLQPVQSEEPPRDNRRLTKKSEPRGAARPKKSVPENAPTPRGSRRSAAPEPITPAVERAEIPKPAPPAPRPAAPAPTPRPVAIEEDDFGAGLDL